MGCRSTDDCQARLLVPSAAHDAILVSRMTCWTATAGSTQSSSRRRSPPPSNRMSPALGARQLRRVTICWRLSTAGMVSARGTMRRVHADRTGRTNRRCRPAWIATVSPARRGPKQTEFGPFRHGPVKSCCSWRPTPNRGGPELGLLKSRLRAHHASQRFTGRGCHPAARFSGGLLRVSRLAMARADQRLPAAQRLQAPPASRRERMIFAPAIQSRRGRPPGLR